jgi:phage terminase large subunit-like protein
MPLHFEACHGDPELKAMGIHHDTYRYDYGKVGRDMQRCYNENGELIHPEELYGIVNSLAPRDLFFLMYFVLDFPVNDPFLLARIYEVQDDWDGQMDLWARGFWKSTIKTHGLPILILIENREERIGIFSHTRGIAKDHMRRTKHAFERNEILKRSFPKIFYQDPKSEAPKWNEDIGIFVKRKKSYIEASIEAWGLVDNLPTGKHFTTQIFDDVIDLKLVNTPAMIKKATESFRQALFLTARKSRKTINGTIYDHHDTYYEIQKAKQFTPRTYPAEVDKEGKWLMREGKPVFLNRQELDKIYDEIGNEYIVNCQMGLSPVGEAFDRLYQNWLTYYNKRENNNYSDLYLYGLADPGKKKERQNDYTVYIVIGTDYLRNYWILDMVRDKMTQAEKWERLKMLVERWGVTQWGYEHVGLASDKEYMDRMMQEDGVFFNIIETNPKNIPKVNRIKTLAADFQRGRVLLPETGIIYQDVNDQWHELIS